MLHLTNKRIPHTVLLLLGWFLSVGSGGLTASSSTVKPIQSNLYQAYLQRKAAAYFAKHMYARAAAEGHNILRKYPNNKAAIDLLKSVTELNPHHLYGLH